MKNKNKNKNNNYEKQTNKQQQQETTNYYADLANNTLVIVILKIYHGHYSQ